MGDWWTFMREVVRSPKSIGAIKPSSPELADLMVKSVDLQDDHHVVELGAGTGAITERILQDISPEKLLCLEMNPRLGTLLEERFPNITVSTRTAQELPDALSDWGVAKVDRMVSGLPWTLWNEEDQRTSLQSIARCLNDDGKIVTFAYIQSLYMPSFKRAFRLMSENFESVTRTRLVWRNTPPAYVYCCSKPKR